MTGYQRVEKLRGVNPLVELFSSSQVYEALVLMIPSWENKVLGMIQLRLQQYTVSVTFKCLFRKILIKMNSIKLYE